MIRLRFQLKQILRYNFACTTNITIRVKIESPYSLSNIILKKYYKIIFKLCCILNFTMNFIV